MRKSTSGARGFTLIELSIVLVIIGLIVGGVLVGQDLIRAAAVRATIAQIEKYNTAVNTFKGKYNALPGDISNWAAFGLAQRTGNTADGDGNGLIEGCWTLGQQAYGCETALFWRDLGDVNLIDGNFDAAYSGGDFDNPLGGITAATIASYLPAAKLGAGNYIAVFTGGYPHEAGWPVSGTAGNNYFFLGVLGVPNLGEDFFPSAGPSGLTPSQAYAIDKKVDDGQPLTGTVQIVANNEPNHNLVPDTPGAAACATSNTVYNLAPTYTNQTLCDLIFQFQ